MFSGAIMFPFLVWGGYVFLPFDAPLLETAPLRLVYTLRCSVFAVVPIVLGEELNQIIHCFFFPLFLGYLDNIQFMYVHSVVIYS